MYNLRYALLNRFVIISYSSSTNIPVYVSQRVSAGTVVSILKCQMYVRRRFSSHQTNCNYVSSGYTSHSHVHPESSLTFCVRYV